MKPLAQRTKKRRSLPLWGRAGVGARVQQPSTEGSRELAGGAPTPSLPQRGREEHHQEHRP